MFVCRKKQIREPEGPNGIQECQSYHQNQIHISDITGGGEKGAPGVKKVLEKPEQGLEEQILPGK